MISYIILNKLSMIVNKHIWNNDRNENKITLILNTAISNRLYQKNIQYKVLNKIIYNQKIEIWKNIFIVNQYI